MIRDIEEPRRKDRGFETGTRDRSHASHVSVWRLLCEDDHGADSVDVNGSGES